MSEPFLTCSTDPLSYKFIYFDLDDTLLNHKSAERSGLQDVHQNFSMFEDTKPQKLIEVYHKVNSEQWSLYSQGDVSRAQLQRNRFEQTLVQLELDKNRYEEIGNHYIQCYSNHWEWMDGAKQAYHQILEDFPVGILTNGFAETQRKKFKAFDLYDSAEHTVISEDVGVLKPHPKVFEHATELAGVEPAEILYVGDSFSSDIQGGSKFGWNTAWYTNNGDAEKHEKADLVFNNFKDLLDLLKISNTQL